MNKTVIVLMGGWSAEREISLISGAACSQALKRSGYDVLTIDVQRDIGALSDILATKECTVFNALHGRFGEDGSIQGLLDIMQIPYTHSGVLASAIAMNKPMAKKIFADAGLCLAPDKVITADSLWKQEPLVRPYVLKPLNEGSSVGIHIVRDDPMHALLERHQLSGEIMAEAFIPGRELTVAVMGKGAEATPLTVTEVCTERHFYDYEAKYQVGVSEHIVPASIEQSVFTEAMRVALVAHQSLGCRGVTRTDMRYDGEKLYVLELNTQPGMTPTSLVPEQAAIQGMDFDELVTKLVTMAEYDG